MQEHTIRNSTKNEKLLMCSTLQTRLWPISADYKGIEVFILYYWLIYKRNCLYPKLFLKGVVLPLLTNFSRTMCFIEGNQTMFLC